jgi:hypothetical protein
MHTLRSPRNFDYVYDLLFLFTRTEIVSKADKPNTYNNFSSSFREPFISAASA